MQAHTQGKKVQLVQDRDPDAEAPNHLSPSEPPQALPLFCFTVTLTCNTHTQTFTAKHNTHTQQHACTCARFCCCFNVSWAILGPFSVFRRSSTKRKKRICVFSKRRINFTSAGM